MICSFDIFDTLITRISYRPEGIFLYVQEYLMQHNIEFDISFDLLKKFCLLRINAEKNARYYHGEGDVTFDEIYQVLADMTGITLSEVEKIKTIEKKMELLHSIGIKENIELLKKKLLDNNEVVLISDMYLEEEFIRSLLIKQDKIFENIPIYVSGKCNKTKGSGELYKYVGENNKWDFSKWIHYGDNENADLYIPLTLGIEAHLINKKEFYTWNRDIIDNKWLTESVEAQLILGINQYLENTMDQSTNYKIGFSVAGPILFNYVRWIVDFSGKNKIESLFFIARDGYILKKIADLYIKSQDLSISTKYIYGSRKAWRTKDISEQELVKKYFYQEIGEQKRYAFVDLQGTGESIENLTKIVGEKIRVFYFYYFGNNKSASCQNYIYTLKNEFSYIETLCRANHGATVGYKLDASGKCLPILQEENMTKLQIDIFEQYVNGINDFTSLVCNLQKQSGIICDFEQVGNIFLRQIYDATDKNISDFIGEIPFSHENMPNRVYAPIISEEEIKLYIKNPDLYRGDNIVYSVKRSGDGVKKIYNQAIEGRNSINWKVKIKEKVRIIQFGAGKLGKAFHPYFEQLECVEIVGWADSLYMYYETIGMNVKNIREIKTLNYDYLVMTIGKGIIDEVTECLLEEGVPKNKIVTLDEFKNILEMHI